MQRDRKKGEKNVPQTKLMHLRVKKKMFRAAIMWSNNQKIK